MNYVETVRNKLSQKIHVNNSLLNLYSLLVLVKGTGVTLKDVHDAWALDKNRTFSEHSSIRPFEELSYEVQAKDRKYQNAIIETAREVNKLKNGCNKWKRSKVSR